MKKLSSSNKVSLTTLVVAMATNFDFKLFIRKTYTKLNKTFNLSIVSVAEIECQRWVCMACFVVFVGKFSNRLTVKQKRMVHDTLRLLLLAATNFSDFSELVKFNTR